MRFSALLQHSNIRQNILKSKLIAQFTTVNDFIADFWEFWSNCALLRSINTQQSNLKNQIFSKCLSAKKPLIIGLFCRKLPIKIRHPMGLRQPVVGRPFWEWYMFDIWLANQSILLNRLRQLTIALSRPIGCLELRVSFRKRATNDMLLLRKMTHKDKASFAFLLPCKLTMGWLRLVGSFKL